MKLVDKDEIMKFPVRLDNYDETNGRRQYVLGIEAVLGYIHEMPTVDAIPVEWIKKYIVDNTKVIDDLKYEVGANPVNYYIYPQQIAKMLTAWWEKENESNI